MSAPKLEARGLNLYYGDFHALKDVSIRIPEAAITALIGPSGCGKSTLLRVFNRMNDLILGVRITGQVALHGLDIYARMYRDRLQDVLVADFGKLHAALGDDADRADLLWRRWRARAEGPAGDARTARLAASRATGGARRLPP